MAFPIESSKMYKDLIKDPMKSPLQWETLKLKEEAERESDIRRRVAHYSQVCLDYPEISKEGVDALDKARQKSKETGKMESDNPSQKPHAELKRLYPLDSKTIEDFAQKKKDKYIAANKSEPKKFNPGAFDEFINSYKTIEECKKRNPVMYEKLVASAAESLSFPFGAIGRTFMDGYEAWRAFSKYNGLENTELELFLASVVNKILVFGGVSIAPGLPPSSHDSRSLEHFATEDLFKGLIETIQHWTVVCMRLWLAQVDRIKVDLEDPKDPKDRKYLKFIKFLKDLEDEHERSDNIKVYLQSQYYLDLDKRLASEYEMQVLNADTDKTGAWLMIDESTIIVELQPSFPNLQLAFEITRPAAVLSFQPLTEESFEPIAVFPAVIETEGENIQIPGIGRSAYNFGRFSKDYATFEIKTPRKTDLGFVIYDGSDGRTGEEHILKQPMLYIRKPYVV